MRNIKLTIEYDGTNYAGWQCQKPRVRTVQGVLERALRKILRERAKLIASGRTDAGVHAAAQVANFKTARSIPAQNLRRALNSFLPPDIAVTAVEEAPLDFHSRFSAKSKVYRYTILNQPYPSAFLRNTACFCPHPLNIRLMRDAAARLIGRRDFKAFCASGSGAKTTIRTVKKISIKASHLPFFSLRYPLIIIDIEADGFLYNMARNIAGTLIEIGRGKLKKSALKKILASGDRKLAGPAACACGLCLLKVNYYLN